MTALRAWQNFYMIMGASAGSLIGLQFVVIALVANLPNRDQQAQGGENFVAPTLVHFGMVLLLAGIVSAPWDNSILPAGCMISAGLIGAIYMALVIGRMRRHTAYRPEFEDWLFHGIFPIFAYMLLSASAVAVLLQQSAGLYGVAASVLLLLAIGIHNAWDNASYHIFARKRPLSDSSVD